MPDPIFEDPVVAEVHAIREKMLADCNGNHQKLMEQVRLRESSSTRRVIAAPAAPQPVLPQGPSAIASDMISSPR